MTFFSDTDRLCNARVNIFTRERVIYGTITEIGSFGIWITSTPTNVGIFCPWSAVEYIVKDNSKDSDSWTTWCNELRREDQQIMKEMEKRNEIRKNSGTG